MRFELMPASRFVAGPSNSDFPTQYGKTIYTKVERPGGHCRDLTWASARGVMVWFGRRCFYVPLFFWRPLA